MNLKELAAKEGISYEAAKKRKQRGLLELVPDVPITVPTVTPKPLFDSHGWAEECQELRTELTELRNRLDRLEMRTGHVPTVTRGYRDPLDQRTPWED